jgi:hypothetical protein
MTRNIIWKEVVMGYFNEQFCLERLNKTVEIIVLIRSRDLSEHEGVMAISVALISFLSE